MYLLSNIYFKSEKIFWQGHFINNVTNDVTYTFQDCKLFISVGPRTFQQLLFLILLEI